MSTLAVAVGVFFVQERWNEEKMDVGNRTKMRKKNPSVWLFHTEGLMIWGYSIQVPSLSTL